MSHQAHYAAVGGLLLAWWFIQLSIVLASTTNQFSMGQVAAPKQMNASDRRRAQDSETIDEDMLFIFPPLPDTNIPFPNNEILVAFPTIDLGDNDASNEVPQYALLNVFLPPANGELDTFMITEVNPEPTLVEEELDTVMITEVNPAPTLVEDVPDQETTLESGNSAVVETTFVLPMVTEMYDASPPNVFPPPANGELDTVMITEVNPAPPLVEDVPDQVTPLESGMSAVVETTFVLPMVTETHDASPPNAFPPPANGELDTVMITEVNPAPQLVEDVPDQVTPLESGMSAVVETTFVLPMVTEMHDVSPPIPAVTSIKQVASIDSFAQCIGNNKAVYTNASLENAANAYYTEFMNACGQSNSAVCPDGPLTDLLDDFANAPVAGRNTKFELEYSLQFDKMQSSSDDYFKQMCLDAGVIEFSNDDDSTTQFCTLSSLNMTLNRVIQIDDTTNLELDMMIRVEGFPQCLSSLCSTGEHLTLAPALINQIASSQVDMLRSALLLVPGPNNVKLVTLQEAASYTETSSQLQATDDPLFRRQLSNTTPLSVFSMLQDIQTKVEQRSGPIDLISQLCSAGTAFTSVSCDVKAGYMVCDPMKISDAHIVTFIPAENQILNGDTNDELQDELAIVHQIPNDSNIDPQAGLYQAPVVDEEPTIDNNIATPNDFGGPMALAEDIMEDPETFANGDSQVIEAAIQDELVSNSLSGGGDSLPREGSVVSAPEATESKPIQGDEALRTQTQTTAQALRGDSSDGCQFSHSTIVFSVFAAFMCIAML
jgi:hypothetical protein